MRGKHRPAKFSFGCPTTQGPATEAGALLCTISNLLDFEPIRNMVGPYFAERGRLAISPVIMVKVMLPGYVFGIARDRQLVDESGDRLSFREFLELGANEPRAAHWSFTHSR